MVELWRIANSKPLAHDVEGISETIVALLRLAVSVDLVGSSDQLRSLERLKVGAVLHCKRQTSVRNFCVVSVSVSCCHRLLGGDGAAHVPTLVSVPLPKIDAARICTSQFLTYHSFLLGAYTYA